MTREQRLGVLSVLAVIGLVSGCAGGTATLSPSPGSGQASFLEGTWKGSVTIHRDGLADTTGTTTWTFTEGPWDRPALVLHDHHDRASLAADHHHQRLERHPAGDAWWRTEHARIVCVAAWLSGTVQRQGHSDDEFDRDAPRRRRLYAVARDGRV
jgi:hypothetical protein